MQVETIITWKTTNDNDSEEDKVVVANWRQNEAHYVVNVANSSTVQGQAII